MNKNHPWVKENKRRLEKQLTLELPCKHHEIIEGYIGRCKLCGAVKDYMPLQIKEGIYVKGLGKHVLDSISSPAAYMKHWHFGETYHISVDRKSGYDEGMGIYDNVVKAMVNLP
uniref:Uncharacterized protein n=1 Tax=viral metagenome TaxID=1070528 RepID=A0A6M3LIV9_9ZZZZ